MQGCHTNLISLRLTCRVLNAAAAKSAAATPALSLQAAARPGFEEGAAIIFRRWTALQLAVEQVPANESCSATEKCVNATTSK